VSQLFVREAKTTKGIKLTEKEALTEPSQGAGMFNGN